jgi:hypothetical protein
MAMKRERCVYRISPKMFERLNDSCLREGIDKSTLIASYIYSFVTQVESKKELDIVDLSYAKMDTNKTEFIQVSIDPILKKRFDSTLKEKGITGSFLIMSYLIHFVLQSEKRRDNQSI